ncbi:Uncharacterized protein Rs2_17934 [Raphanus sativus]|nr:Uncharacterized protein Rs2_17934 [Raphanus sativus]
MQFNPLQVGLFALIKKEVRLLVLHRPNKRRLRCSEQLCRLSALLFRRRDLTIGEGTVLADSKEDMFFDAPEELNLNTPSKKALTTEYDDDNGNRLILTRDLPSLTVYLRIDRDRKVIIYSAARTPTQQGSGKLGKWKINFVSTKCLMPPLEKLFLS